MEMMSDDKVGLLSRGWLWLKALLMGLIARLFGIARKTKTLAKDDPRRVVHSLKLGLALTIVSLLYYFKPLYANFGVSAMWAVMTVVVVFEFSVGATIGRGLNRGLATLFAGALGVGAHQLTALSGHIGQPILTSIFVFILAVALTFLRFFPNIKARYDYGVMISILTFALVSISGLRDDEIFELLQKRVSTIFIGVSVCVIISTLVFPVWAGEDLHNRIALNIEKLAIFLEGFGVEYFTTSQSRDLKDEKFTGYKGVLTSRSVEESLHNFALWEPGHGCFQFRHPWKQYLKIGTLTHQCAYRIDALYNNLIASNIQVSQEMRTKIQESCTEMSMESGKALRQLASSMREMTRPIPADVHTEKSKAAAKKLKGSLRSSGLREDCDLLTVIPAATVASLLIDVVECTEKIAESVQELASLAHFKSVKPIVSSEKSEATQSETEKVQPKTGISFVTVPVRGPNTESGLSNQICTQV